MRIARTGIVLLGMLLACCARSAVGQTPMASPLLTQFLPQLRLSVVSGRVVHIGRWRYFNGASTSDDGATHDKVTLRGNGASGSLSYERVGPEVDFSFDFSSDGRMHFVRLNKVNLPNSEAGRIEFTQAAGQPIEFVIGTGDTKRVISAASIWHLMIAEPEAFQRSLRPIFDMILPQEQLNQKVISIELELMRVASGNRGSIRQQWAADVAQLADSEFTRREAADRNLRESGPAVLPYLRQLDLDALDAEQQFRIRRIVKYLSPRNMADRPEEVAASMIDDPEIWFALLKRPEAVKRQAAARQLESILGEKIAVDPAADPATQVKAREALRVKVLKKVNPAK